MGSQELSDVLEQLELAKSRESSAKIEKSYLLRDLQSRLLQGETTGNPVFDFVFAVYGRAYGTSLFDETVSFYQALRDRSNTDWYSVLKISWTSDEFDYGQFSEIRQDSVFEPYTDRFFDTVRISYVQATAPLEFHINDPSYHGKFGLVFPSESRLEVASPQIQGSRYPDSLELDGLDILYWRQVPFNKEKDMSRHSLELYVGDDVKEFLKKSPAENHIFSHYLDPIKEQYKHDFEE